MTPIVAIDTNVIARFLREDHSQLFDQASDIFTRCQNGEFRLYIDPVIVAETAWLFSSHYNLPRSEIVKQLITLISPDWIICPQKRILVSALATFTRTNLSFIDCWLIAICERKGIALKTFDDQIIRVLKKSKSPKSGRD